MITYTMISPVRLAILGSTGSIGRQTLEVVHAFPEKFRVVGLAAGENTNLLKEQIEKFKPEYICCQKLKNAGKQLTLEEMASHPDVDIVVIATPGRSGLLPTLAAAKAGKKIALANKESLVMAGGIITKEVAASGARLMPVDSEHSAIWQCLQGEKTPPAKIVLTASGGPFMGYTPEQLEKVTPNQALTHPSWQMGQKVTIDSATLLNKGLEVIEAHWLFNMPYENISVIIHPQSIIHSMVEFADGSVKAQLGQPDMRLPIQYALTYPERMANDGLPHIKWNELRQLDFEPPDTNVFHCLKLAIEAGKKGDTFPAVLCGAGEKAVELFLSGHIKFTDIQALVRKALDEHQPQKNPDIEQINAAAEWAQQKVAEIAERGNHC